MDRVSRVSRTDRDLAGSHHPRGKVEEMLNIQWLFGVVSTYYAELCSRLNMRKLSIRLNGSTLVTYLVKGRVGL